MQNIVVLKPESYPEQLLHIPKPPKQLYLRGEMPPKDMKLLCIIGSRKNTDYGRHVCKDLVASLKGKNVGIVSGLALGIDAIAHQSALDNKLYTLALPGSGINEKVLHPQTNVLLSRKIIESGGGIVSEFEPDFKATQYSFPMRNRIMAGISHAVLIIEAERKSGTLITSRLATDYNRDVLTIPGSIYSTHSEGPNMLIRIGATPITCAEDLHEALGFEQNQTLNFIEQDLSDCTEQEKNILKIISEHQEISKDDLITETGIATSEIIMCLALLELKGYIRENAGLISKKL
jgi:DNA processing protein